MEIIAGNQMKISVEINGDDFTWSYKIGASEQCGRTCLTSESFLTFAHMLQVCQHAMDSNAKDKLNKLMSEAGARAYMTENRKESIAFLETLT